MATNYDVNYDDERFAQVEGDKQQALTDLEQTYGGMINQTDDYYQAQIDAANQWADKQSQLQQEKTDFTIEQIEQQKDKAQKDYTKEQSGAYVDWQKQSNQYGVNAEQQAAAGMDGTGFSESSQVGMYNTYQNRIASARESYNQAVLNYDNAIKDARLQNNSVLAEIAYEALQQQLELSLQGFQYKNQLILDQANKKTELENTYYNRYLDVLNQINTENALAEDIRQFDQNYALQTEQLALQKKELDETIRQFNQNYSLKIKEYNENIRQFNEEIARLKAKDAKEYELEIKNLELNKQKLAEEKRQFEESQKLKKQQLAEEKRQFDATLAYNKSKSSSSSSTIKKSPSSSDSSKAVVNKDDTTSTPTNNMASITALGYGPISEATLAKKLASGEVVRTLKNGQYYYSRRTYTPTLIQTGSYGLNTTGNRLKNMGLSGKGW